MKGCGWEFIDGSIVTIIDTEYIEDEDVVIYEIETKTPTETEWKQYRTYLEVYEYLKSKGDSIDVVVATTTDGWETKEVFKK